MSDEGLGKIAGKWLKARAKELTTTDRHERVDADHEAEQLEREAKEKASEEVFYAALPGLREMKERQEAGRLAARIAADEEREAELRSRGQAGVSIRVAGVFDGDLVGHLPTVAETLPPTAGPDGRPLPDPDDVDDPDGYQHDWVDPDPYSQQPTLRVQLSSFIAERPEVGGHRFGEWTIFVPGYVGDGVYDLVAIHQYRDQLGVVPDYIDWVFSVDDAEDDFYFYPDAGPATVTVTDSGRAVDVVMAMGSSGGEITVNAAIRLPQG